MTWTISRLKCIVTIVSVDVGRNFEWDILFISCNEHKIMGTLIVVQISVNKTSHFDCLCDKSSFRALWEDARFKEKLKYIS